MRNPKYDPCMSAIERKAYDLFRILHGKGDGGSTHNYLCQNPGLQAGFVRLAKMVERKTKMAELGQLVTNMAEMGVLKQCHNLQLWEHADGNGFGASLELAVSRSIEGKGKSIHEALLDVQKQIPDEMKLRKAKP